MRAILKAFVLTAAAAAAASASAQQSVDRVLPADARGEVEIVNVSGEVQVHGWDRNEVRVRADLGSGVERLDFHSSQGRTTINVIVPGNRGSGGSTDLKIDIPRQSMLAVKTVSADQIIAEIRGAQRLQAVSGSITTEVWNEDITAKTISGDVSITGRREPGVINVNTVSGDVVLLDVAGELALQTVTGDMEVTMPTLTRARIRTTNGDLRLHTALARDARVEAEAINGDLSFMLRSPVDAEFDVETFNGQIDNCFGPKPERTREFAPGNAVRFKEGAGTARVRIKTLNGGVEICK